MAEQSLTNPVTGNEVPKIDNAVDVGEDLAFQERWWKFERATWWFFLLILIADALGAFGRGWLAKAKIDDPSTGMQVDYERVERASTPSIMKIVFAPGSVQNGKVQLYTSNSLVKQFGTQRVIPQPENSTLTDGGILYTFGAQSGQLEIQFALEPSFPGVHSFTLQVPGKQSVSRRIAVVP